MTSYDKNNAENYWGKERFSSGKNDLAIVLSLGQADYINQAYDKWESGLILGCLGNLENKKVLDIACGVGRITVRLAEKNAKVSSIDLSQTMLDKTKKALEEKNLAGKAELIKTSSDNLPFDKESFDSVICAGLFEHIPQELREKTMLEAKKVLKSGGKFVLVLNNNKSVLLQSPEDNEFRKGKQFNSGYFCGLVEIKQVKKFLEENGFAAELKGSNLFYSLFRHAINAAKAEKEEKILSNVFNEAAELDLKFKLKPGMDEKYADHFVLMAVKE